MNAIPIPTNTSRRLPLGEPTQIERTIKPAGTATTHVHSSVRIPGRR